MVRVRVEGSARASEPHGLTADSTRDIVHAVRRIASAREDNWDESSGSTTGRTGDRAAITHRAHPSHASATNEGQFRSLRRKTVAYRLATRGQRLTAGPERPATRTSPC